MYVQARKAAKTRLIMFVKEYFTAKRLNEPKGRTLERNQASDGALCLRVIVFSCDCVVLIAVCLFICSFRCLLCCSELPATRITRQHDNFEQVCELLC